MLDREVPVSETKIKGMLTYEEALTRCCEGATSLIDSVLGPTCEEELSDPTLYEKAWNVSWEILDKAFNILPYCPLSNRMK